MWQCIHDMDVRIKRIAIKINKIRPLNLLLSLAPARAQQWQEPIANQLIEINTHIARKYMNDQHGGHAHFDIVSTCLTEQM